MTESGARYSYPSRVALDIAQDDLASYRSAAAFLESNAVDVVCVQHEYGIFGSRAGSHVLELLSGLSMPIVTTLHTILARPDAAQREVMTELCRISERLVVMSTHGQKLLRDVYGIPERKIDWIPHGIPALPNPRDSKSRIGVHGKKVILTFGLLSPDKGIEHVIDAMPSILERHPEARYIVLGATHPHVRQRHGEAYRSMLAARARELGVESSVVFHDAFVSRAQLTEYLAAADLYVTPYEKAEQITSGTLAYAVGSGKAVISTPYWYACELLADGRGVLVPWRDPRAIAVAAADLLGDDAKRAAMSERAAALGPQMRWPGVAGRYLESFTQARADHATEPRVARHEPSELPAVELEHLSALSDSTGVLQHALYDVPRREDGYCLDDNARALLAMVLMDSPGGEQAKVVRPLLARYLAFVRHAFDGDRRRFRNFMSYSRSWLEAAGSEDSQGRALWALGALVGRSPNAGWRILGSQLFHAALPPLLDFTSPRAWAFALLGMDEYLAAFAGDGEVQALRNDLATRLVELFVRARRPDWAWFEDSVTYSNASLCQALIASGSRMGDERVKQVGMTSLTWLVEIQTDAHGDFAPVGSNGFFRRGADKARFDQQPLEAGATISACLEAERATGDPRWAERAVTAFGWFFGKNQLGAALIDAQTGACRDGLHADRLNENRGAESTLSFLLALLEMRARHRSGPAALVGGRA
ncbi:MAG: hypothetical protein AMXMBFR56_73980 [Polyangiaceae bacterium]